MVTFTAEETANETQAQRFARWHVMAKQFNYPLSDEERKKLALEAAANVKES